MFKIDELNLNGFKLWENELFLFELNSRRSLYTQITLKIKKGILYYMYFVHKIHT